MANLRNGKWYTVIAVLALMALAGGGLAWKAGQSAARPLAPVPEAVMTPFKALFTEVEAFDPPEYPAFDMKLVDMADAPVAWDVMKGRVTLINFWALWCPPCLRELPSLKALEDEGIAGFDVAYISMDFPENAGQLADVMKLRKVPGIDTYYIRDLNAWESVELTALPTSIIVDRKGRIAYRLKGDIDWQKPEARAFIEALLK